MKVKKVFLVVFSSLIFIFGYSGYSQAISLNDAIDIALKNNLQISLTRERVRQAEQKVKEATAGYLPSINLNGTYTHLGKVPSMSTPFGEFPMGEQDTTSLTFSLTQPLYTGGRLTLNSKQAKLNYLRAEKELQQTQSEVIYQVKEGFYSVLLATKNLEIAQRALNQAKAHLEIVESFYKSGRASRFDLLRAKVEVANLKPDVIKARNNLSLARERLAGILSVPSSSLDLEGELEFKSLTLTLDDAIKIAFNSRGDLNSLKLQEEIARVSLQVAKVRNFPSLSFVGNYQFTHPGEKEEWDKDWNISLVLSFPFFDMGKRAFVRERESQLRQVQLAIKQLKDAIQLEVKKAFWDMEAAKEAIAAQKKNIQQAQEALSIAEARYRSGTITQIEVLDASLALTRARLGYTRALYNYNMAKAALIKAIGKIKE